MAKVSGPLSYEGGGAELAAGNGPFFLQLQETGFSR